MLALSPCLPGPSGLAPIPLLNFDTSQFGSRTRASVVWLRGTRVSWLHSLEGGRWWCNLSLQEGGGQHRGPETCSLLGFLCPSLRDRKKKTTESQGHLRGVDWGNSRADTCETPDVGVGILRRMGSLVWALGGP